MIMKGQKINDRYQIIKTIGEGGMANVYLAYDTILDRNVAVKVLRGDLATDEKFVRRFQREALSASSLSHPNIVEVYDVGEDNGSYFIVMEYIEGKHLKQLLKKRGNLTLTEVVDIMLQITDGMSAAHDSYIIHRDIKPQNIMILENGLIKITDFGIAMALNSTQLTQTNSVMGSVHYLPPEQASGKGATIQSDVYSMGILMFELLTGTLPFRGDNAVEIALKHIKEPFPSIREALPNIPQSIENIIMRATAKNVKNRYVDAKEMNDDLKTALTDARINEPIYKFEYHDEEGETKKKAPAKAEPTILDEPPKTEKPKKQPKPKKEKPSKKKDENDAVKVKKIDEEDAAALRKQNKILLVLGVVFTLLVLIVTTLVFLIPKITAEAEIEVPDVSGMTVVKAEKTLKELGFEIDEEYKEVSSSEVKVGDVVKTSPGAGTTRKEGAEITIYISKGETAYIVGETVVGDSAELVGRNYQEIKGALEAKYNLHVKTQDADETKGYKPGQIVSVDKEKGTKLTEGDSITLIIVSTNITYPKFTDGKHTLKEIRKFCADNGVNLDEVYEQTSSYEPGTIFYQSLSEGVFVMAGQTLQIRIAEAMDEIDEDMSAEEIDGIGNEDQTTEE